MSRFSLLLLLLPAVAACGGEPRPSAVTADRSQEKANPAATPDGRPVILAFGDSLTAGHGVALGLSYPSRLQKQLDSRGYAYRVVNAGISGDTTSGGLSRIDGALSVRPAIVILELGANDGLRGTPLREVEDNLAQMIEKSQTAGATVVLAGMTLPRNYGADYIGNFEAMYGRLAKQYKTALIPFFLEGVAGHMELNQDDGIHPTAAGYAVITQNVVRYIEPLLRHD
jgi:acyl-CoA thioesterase I